jgi:hypothetical protein
MFAAFLKPHTYETIINPAIAVECAK